MSDLEIDFSDVPTLGTSFFENAKRRMPTKKKSISLRLDSDVLNWFKHEGRGYQTRINAVLRSYAQAHQH